MRPADQMDHGDACFPGWPTGRWRTNGRTNLHLKTGSEAHGLAKAVLDPGEPRHGRRPADLLGVRTYVRDQTAALEPTELVVAAVEPGHVIALVWSADLNPGQAAPA